MLLFLRALGLASLAVLAQAGRVQLPGLTVPPSAAADRASVVQIFNESYGAYRYAKEISNESSLRLVVIGNLPLVMMRWHH